MKNITRLFFCGLILSTTSICFADESAICKADQKAASKLIAEDGGYGDA
jgi:hypothetical protein